MRPALLLLLLMMMPTGAAAQDLPICGSQRQGMTLCFETRLCLCEYQPGGSLTGRPSGYRWDCGILRPSCGVVPPDTNPAPQPPLMIQPYVQAPWTPGRPVTPR